jgi:hypothetical protein
MLYQKVGPLDTDWSPIGVSAPLEARDLIIIEFGTDSDLGNKWLEIFDHHTSTTDKVPAIAEYKLKVVGLTFTNEIDDADVDLEVFVNGITATELVFTWQLRNMQNAWYSGFASDVIFEQGDRIAVRGMTPAVGTGDKPKKNVFRMLCRIVELNDGSGGNNTRDAGPAPTTNTVVIV